MKIELSREEFETLLEGLFLVDYMLLSSESDFISAFDKLKKKLLTIAKHHNFVKFYQEYETGKLDFSFLAEEFDYLAQIINDYEDETFWGKLIDSLAQRDIYNKMSADEFKKLDMSAKWDLMRQYSEIYEIEFDKNGLKNLRFLNPNLPF